MIKPNKIHHNSKTNNTLKIIQNKQFNSKITFERYERQQETVGNSPSTSAHVLHDYTCINKQKNKMISWGKEIMSVIGLIGVFWLGFCTERKDEICVNLGFGNER